MSIWTGLLIGAGAGLVVSPLIFLFISILRNAKERRRIKKMIKQGKFLTPVDSKDYDFKAWQDQKYGNIVLSNEELKNFNDKIFKKSPEELILAKARVYVARCRQLEYSDEYITLELQKKNYPIELINRMLKIEVENGRTT